MQSLQAEMQLGRMWKQRLNMLVEVIQSGDDTSISDGQILNLKAATEGAKTDVWILINPKHS